MQEVKLGNGGLNFLMRFKNALRAPEHPVINPVGKHIHIAHSSPDGAACARGGLNNGIDNNVVSVMACIERL